MVNLNKDHMNELYSKIHDERQCVTSKSLCIDLGITRRDASQLLEAVPTSFNQGDECVYEVTRCVWKKTDGKSVASLRKCEVKASKSSERRTNPQGSIYSIALLTSQNGAASLQSGHAYTMTLLRDALLQQGASPAILCPDLACDCILPADEVRVQDTDESRRARIGGMTTAENGKNRSSIQAVKSVRSSKLATPSTTVIKPKKVNMTAASFFGTTNSKFVKKAESGKVVPKGSKKNDKINNKFERNERIAEENEEKVVTSTTRKSGKRASTKKRKEKDISKTVGNADDFVGDEDEDDDFVKEDEQRQRRNAVAARKSVRETAEKKTLKKPQRRIPPPEDDTDADTVADEMGHTVEGAMDTYAAPKTDGGQKGGSKRRKQVLEEKTSVDENGFLRTEVVPVWKEVPDVEEKKANPSRPHVRSGKTNAVGHTKAGVKKDGKMMKQQALFGFFKPKNK